MLNIRRILKFLIKMQKYMQLHSVLGCVDKDCLDFRVICCDSSCNKKDMSSSFYPSICLSVQLSACLSLYLSIYLFVCLSIYKKLTALTHGFFVCDFKSLGTHVGFFFFFFWLGIA